MEPKDDKKMDTSTKKVKRNQRRKRVRAKIIGTAERPRISVFRSNRNVWVQLIDDAAQKTLAAVSTREPKAVKKSKGKNDSGAAPVQAAEKIGELIAKKAQEHKIEQAVFDRGGYKYHGIVKSVAEGARKGGLKF